MSAALAFLAARQGKRTLAVEVDEKGNLTDFFEHDRVGYEPVEVQRNLWAFTENTEDALNEYLRIFLRMPVLSRLGPVARIFDFVATAAPGVREILVTGKIAWEARERRKSGRGAGGEAGQPKWDLIVVDSQATGHIVAQLEAHRTVGELVSVGAVRQQTEWMADIFEDPQFRARDMLLEHVDPEFGPYIGPGIVPKLSETPGAVRWSATWEEGSHNRDVYGGLLGLSGEELEELHSEGIL